MSEFVNLCSRPGATLLADKGCDANAFATWRPRAVLNKSKQYHLIATRYDKMAKNFRTALKLAALRLWLRVNESTT
jgi:transposase